MMKAIVVEQYGSTENMKYVEMDIPKISSKQVLIRVMVTSVNFADIKARYGKKGHGTLPYIPGLEAAGIIVQIGDEVTDLSIGQRVMAFPHQGSYAEYIVADENLTYAIPNHMSFEVAGSCGIVSFLSYKLLADVARIQVGETILIHSASGGVGTTAIQIAKALGAQTIIGTVSNNEKALIAIEAGADHVICYTKEDFSKKVNEITDNKGVNIILDSIGGEITERSINCLAKFGRLVIFGNSCGHYGHIQTSDLHASCRTVLGYSLGTTRKEQPEQLRKTSLQVFTLLDNGQLTIKISEKFPLKDAAIAHRLLESRNSQGKILLFT